MKMRPDRIIVGEVLGDEALYTLQAMATGHTCMFTIHATSPRDMLSRLEALIVSANPSIAVRAAREQIATGLDLIVYMERLRDGSRKLTKITEVTGLEGDVVATQDIFEFQQTGYESGKVLGRFAPTKRIPKLMDQIQAANIDLPLDIFMPR
jgi:pilus assembly protein CpaF